MRMGEQAGSGCYSSVTQNQDPLNHLHDGGEVIQWQRDEALSWPQPCDLQGR